MQRAEYMFPEGLGRARAAPKVGAPAPFINALLCNSKAAVDALWKQRGYDKMKSAVIESRLGYKLDREEAKGYVLTGAIHLPLPCFSSFSPPLLFFAPLINSPEDTRAVFCIRRTRAGIEARL